MSISASIRAELDQTPEWWQAQYDTLVRKQIPRNPEYHADHDLEDGLTFYAADYSMAPWCATCGVRLDRTPDG